MKEKTESPTGPAEKYKAFLDRTLCTFQTAGRRCQMLGGHTDNGSDHRLCSWHWLCKSNPKILQNHDEFIAYRNGDRNIYPKEWLSAHLYVDDEIAWACTLGKERRVEFVRAARVIEMECDGKRAPTENPPTPEVSVEKYAKSLPF